MTFPVFGRHISRADKYSRTPFQARETSLQSYNHKLVATDGMDTCPFLYYEEKMIQDLYDTGIPFFPLPNSFSVFKVPRAPINNQVPAT